MANGSIRITPFLNIGILHSDRAFCGRLQTLLGILGVKTARSMQSAEAFAQFVAAGDCDLAFIEIADDFDGVWDGLRDVCGQGILVVGVSDARSGRDWPWAIRRGADTILLKPYYPSLLREMLSHLLESPAARRCRIVQFPLPGDRDDAMSKRDVEWPESGI